MSRIVCQLVNTTAQLNILRYAKAFGAGQLLAYCILYPHPPYRGHSKLFEPLPGISRLSLT